MSVILLSVLVFCVFALLLFKMFKAILTFIGCIVFIVAFAFFLRSMEVVSFEVPKDLSFESFNFQIGEEIKEEVSQSLKQRKEEKEEKINNEKETGEKRGKYE